MRFSLATLILAVLWLGSLALVWTQRDAWVKVSTTPLADHETFLMSFGSGTSASAVSPDKRRRFEIRHVDGERDCAVIMENAAGSEVEADLWLFDGNFYAADFADNDTAILNDYTDEIVYHRRHPEWWWGHLYRPEVWIAAALSGVGIFRAVRFFSSRRI